MTKTVEQHIRDGTFDITRHGKRSASLKGLCTKPSLRAKTRCGNAAVWIRNEADTRAVRAGCYFDESQAAYVVKWFRKYLKHSKGRWRGKPFELLPWQIEDVIYPLFGWFTKEKRRRFKRTYIEIPKKNGKSTLAAGIALYALVGDAEPASLVFSAATERNQAGIVHDEAIAMIHASFDLSQFLKINRTTRAIYNHDHDLSYRVLSSDPRSVEGHHAHCVIMDELHAWYGTATWNALRYSIRSRENGFLFVITTAGDDMESECRKQHEYATAVRSGEIEDHSMLGVIYGASEIDDLEDEATWHKANPSMGHTFHASDFESDLKEALQNPRSLNAMKRYGFDIWTQQHDAWLDDGVWDRAAGSYTLDDCEGLTCWAALDLARKNDISALCLLFDRGDETYWCWPWFWLPEDTAKRYKQLASFELWAREKHLTLTRGEVADYRRVEDDIAAIFERFKPRALAFDDEYAEELTQRLTERTGVERRDFPQTMMAFTGPTTTVERWLVDGTLEHPNHGLLNWQSRNVTTKSDNNANIRPMRAQRGNHKSIDGIIALIMAVGLQPHYADETDSTEYWAELLAG